MPETLAITYEFSEDYSSNEHISSEYCG